MKSTIFVDKITLSYGEGRGEEKTFPYKKRDISKLKIKLRKGQKKVFKKLVKANKGCSFAPAMTQTFFKRLASKTNQRRKFIF